MNQNDINNNTNNQLNNNSVDGMKFVTGDATEATVSKPVQSEVTPSQAQNMSFVTQIPQENVMTQSMVQPEIEVNKTIVPESVNSISNPVTVTTPPTANVLESATVVPPVSSTLQNANVQPVLSAQTTSQPVNSVSVQSQQQSNSVESIIKTNELNSASSVQLTEETLNNPVEIPNVLEDKTPEKKKMNPIVVLLIIVLLTVIGVALGIFLFTKFGNKNSDTLDNFVEETAEISLNNNVINNTDVDTNKLSEVLNIVGIAPTKSVANNNLLNYYVSNSNYKDNINNVILYFVVDDNGNTNSVISYPEGYDKLTDVGACSGSSSCALITKLDAESILKKYNLGTDLTKYFYKSSEIDDVYGIHYEKYNSTMFNGNGLGITHNLNASMINETDINVNDTQSINYKDDVGNNQTNNKAVTYVFKLNSDSIYYLDSVTNN